MRISDWSSDVCSSDLVERLVVDRHGFGNRPQIVKVLHPAIGETERNHGLEFLGDDLCRRIGADARSFHAEQRRIVQGLAGIGERIAEGDIERDRDRSEEHTSELQSLMRISYAVFGWKKNKNIHR